MEALNGPKDEIEKMVKKFEERRNLMIDRIKSITGLSIIRPEGAFYVMINLENYLGKSINENVINNSVDFSRELLEHEKVAVIPGSAFGLDKYIRLSYATSEELILKGLDRIESFLNKLK